MHADQCIDDSWESANDLFPCLKIIVHDLHLILHWRVVRQVGTNLRVFCQSVQAELFTGVEDTGL